MVSWRYASRGSFALRVEPDGKQVASDTRAFNNPADWPEDGSQPFYLSNGDQYVA
jgi:hypothetical protein